MFKDNRFVFGLIVLIFISFVFLVWFLLSKVQFGDNADEMKIKTEKTK